MRNLMALPLLLMASLPLLASRAQAQIYHGGPKVIPAPDYDYGDPPAPSPNWQPAQQYQTANMGGGLIEFLATGGKSGYPQPGYAPPPSPYGQPQGAYNAPGGFAGHGGPDRASRMAYAVPPAQPNAYQRPVMSEPEPQYRRQEVAYDGPQAPGTLVIDTPNKFLYLVEPGRRAIRYGIGVGRPGFEWAGMKTVTRKAEWPGWTPPPEMLKRRPDLPAHMDGGPANPLGARAMYLGSSLYRIHGTNEPETIGKAVSSGCIRMLNDDVVDLYGRVKVGTRVLVI
ncbi:Lipoprotein-anchoring transpeptidase ErfK/SrfK [Rhizobiales bacterium GAS113]|nr:Lipoprotein-anchoring transpeptidase ErfK/SrfK [Rhizobiales bacterium GAS113]